MKRKTLYLWGLLLLFLGVVNSCRNDFLQEHQANHEIRNQGLTHKMIALSQSKHKDRLSRQLSEIKTELNKTNFKNALGKIVNYGDSITINTEHVIYIENGNYHTYTFNIQRSNSSPSDAVENLLLSQLSDGTYKEFLVTYSLTQQEKENISNGIYSYSNNAKVVELASGTFNGNNQLTRMNCGWTTETIWVSCSQHVHDQSNWQDWGSCTASTPPSVYTITKYSCVEEQDETIAPTDPGSSGGGGGGGGAPCTDCPPPTDPVECVQVPNNPQSPSTIVDENGCAIGTPTLPNIAIAPRNSPCGKVKSQFAKEKYKKKKDSIDKHEYYKKTHETGFREQKNGDLVDLPQSGSNALSLTYTANTIGYTHVHLDDITTGETNELGQEKVKKKIRIHSPADVAVLMGMASFSATSGTFGDLYGTMLSRNGTYVIKFTGTASDINTSFSDTPANIKKWRDKFATYFKENDGRTNETNFLLFLRDEMQANGISLFKVKNNGSVYEVKLNETGKKAISEKCSD